MRESIYEETIIYAKVYVPYLINQEIVKSNAI